jgi:hypothetical protein
MTPKDYFRKLHNRTRIDTKIQSNYGHMLEAVVFSVDACADLT